jgi:hypothetical protein
MVRNGSIVLGIGLVILWIVGLANGQPHWMGWLDLFGALCAFAGASYSLRASPSARVAGPIALGVGLFALFIAGLASHASSAITWANFGFGLGFLVLGLSEANTQRQARALGHPV